ncbi:MAG TPA: lipopolysaccharide biosynthesis protein [Gemmatimonadales bacterium]|nr:lipopolysaccharide biosynthesis protein [Gemmatimonadales bacterium]
MRDADGGRALGRRTAAGFIWALLGAGAGKLLALASIAVLARLLAPAEFGLFAFALVYIAYLDTFGDLGTGAALVYWPDRARDVAQVTFALNLLTGVAWFLLTWVLAPAVATFFHSPEGAPILRALGATFPLTALANTHDALCTKDLRFRARFIPEIGLAAVKAVLTIALALAGVGVWSLVWGHLVATGVRGALLWLVVPWRPAWRWPAGLLRPVLRYGGWIVMVDVIAVIVHHADYVVVGRLLGVTTLAFYQMAYKVPEAVVIVLVWQASLVLFPAFSKAQASGRSLGDAYLTALRYFSLLVVPAAVSVVLLADPIVLTLFGEAWRPSIPILRVLAVYTGLRALETQAGDVLKAQGRPKLLAALGALKALILVPALVVAARWDATAVAATMAAVAGAMTLLDFALVRHTAGVPAGSILGAVATSLLPAAVLAVVLTVWTHAAAGAGSPLALAGGVALGLGAYLVAVRVLSPRVYRRAMSTLWPRPPAGAAAVP